MDLEGAESAAVLLGQVRGDHWHDPRVVGAGEHFQQRPPPQRRQLLGHQPVHGRGGKAVQARILGECLLHRRLAADEPLVQPRGQVDLAGDLALLVEVDVELLGKVLQRRLGHLAVFQQGLAVLDLHEPRRSLILVAVQPPGQHGIGLVQLPGRLMPKAQIVEVVLRAGDELLEGLVLVGRQDVVLDEADFLGGAGEASGSVAAVAASRQARRTVGLCGMERFLSGLCGGSSGSNTIRGLPSGRAMVYCAMVGLTPESAGSSMPGRAAMKNCGKS